MRDLKNKVLLPDLAINIIALNFLIDNFFFFLIDSI